MITTMTHRPLALALASALVLAFALSSAVLTPRGPVTSSQALVTMVAAFVVGLLVAAVTGERWALVLAPAAFIVVFELARMGAWGPTVDAPASFGLLHVLAFLLGRVPHGLLAVAPMVLGGLIGLAVAPRLGVPGAASLGVGGWIAASALAVALSVVGVVISRPASTAPILGADGRVLPGSVAELTTVVIGGHEQAIMIRGRSASLPVLLHLAGGPGGTDIGAMRLDTGLEQHFVVATWDQRGSGKSYPAFDPAATLTLEQVVADTIEVTEYLAARFGRERIFIAGQSWGTIPATLAVQRRPELYHALIGTGQMVDVRETDWLFYEDTDARVYPQLQELDLRVQVPALEVPIWLVMGRHEARGRVEPARSSSSRWRRPESTGWSSRGRVTGRTSSGRRSAPGCSQGSRPRLGWIADGSL